MRHVPAAFANLELALVLAFPACVLVGATMPLFLSLHGQRTSDSIREKREAGVRRMGQPEAARVGLLLPGEAICHLFSFLSRARRHRLIFNKDGKNIADVQDTYTNRCLVGMKTVRNRIV
jgi:hypothetical protein